MAISNETREDFMQSIYDMFSDDGNNDRANQIIDIFDIATENCIELPSSNLPIKIYLSDSIDKNFILRNYSVGDGIYMVIQCIETQEYFCRGLNEYRKTVFLTREEAEKALNSSEKPNC